MRSQSVPGVFSLQITTALCLLLFPRKRALGVNLRKETMERKCSVADKILKMKEKAEKKARRLKALPSIVILPED